MKIVFKKVLSMVLSVGIAASTVPMGFCLSAQAADTKTAYTLQESTAPTGLQANLTFPDWAGYVDDTLIMNNKYSFKGYRGQGTMYITCKNIKSARFFINGHEMDISTALNNNGKTYKLDISNYTTNGTNSLQINDFNPSTGTINVKIPYPTVISGKAADVNVSQDNLNLIDTLINNDVKYGFTSAELAVIKDGVMIKNSAYGSLNSYNQDGTKKTDSQKVTTNTLYDLASNTKMYATNYALQKLTSEGKISINDKVTKYFPEFKDGANDPIKGKADLTLKEIMEHQAGFPADPQYFNDHYNQTTQKTDPNVSNTLFSQDKATTIKRIMATPLTYVPGTNTKYSDVDYMLLGLIVEKVTGQNLDTYVENNIYKPMGLKRIMYNPLQKGLGVNDCAATELNGNTRDGAVNFVNIRKNTLQGQVHDEKAYYCMGGVSGHAGLFSTAGDLAKLCQVMLNGGGYGGSKFFDKNTIAQFTKRKDSSSVWGLGWWREGDQGRPWYFGVDSSENTIGHQGWTGTLTMIDPDKNLVIVLLTNKINSPVIDKKANPNDFAGNKFTTATLGTIPEIVYQAINNYSDKAVNANIAAMVTEKMKLYNEEKGEYDQKAVLQAVYPLVDTAINRAETCTSKETIDYAKSSFAQLPQEADQKISAAFAKRIAALHTFKSDTNHDLVVNDSYTFRITSLDGEVPAMTFDKKNVFTQQMVNHSGNDYYIKITAVGKKGDSCGISVNGEKMLTATVGTNNSQNGNAAVKCDTDYAFTLPQGEEYTYRFEVSGSQKQNLAIYPTNTSVLQPLRCKKTVEKDHDVYYYTVKAVGAAGSKAAVYTRLPGQKSVTHGTAMIKAAAVKCDTDYAFILPYGKAYTYRFEVLSAQGQNLAIFPTDTSVLQPVRCQKTAENGHDVYYYTIKAVGTAGSKATVYTRLPNQQAVKHGAATVK
jgi:CubicO group peptidase (beta-lactamase class C family)